MALIFISYFFICAGIPGCNIKSEYTLKQEIKSESFSLLDYFSSDDFLRKKTDSIFNTLNDYEKVGQMIVVCGGDHGKLDNEIRKLISNKKVGGILLLGGTREKLKNQIAEFRSVAENSHTLPLIFSTDGEPGLINNKIYDIKEFQPAGSISDSVEAYHTAAEIAEILTDIGFNQNYAPVCDFPFNKEIIESRSFGKDPHKISVFSSAFIKATQEKGIIATAKHFPGHGNVKGDSHKNPVYIDGELQEIDAFQNAISSGVISIMAGHISIRNNEKYDSGGLPATLSRKIITDLLRNELNFKGIIVTDAMNMGALAKISQPSLKAVLAGCDMILMPPDEEELISSVLDKMNHDEEIRKQIYASVKRIIRAKICLRLIQ